MKEKRQRKKSNQNTYSPSLCSIRVPRLNSPAFFEIREEGPPPIPPEQAASRSSLTPPPQIPDLGALESAPLTGEGLKDLKPKGILVAHLHEHKGPVVQVKVFERRERRGMEGVR